MNINNKNEKSERIDALVLNENDNVATSTRNLQKGELVVICWPDGKRETLTVSENIPFYHKIAIDDVHEGANINKYGFPIGRSTKEIYRGQHVHLHNIVSKQEEAK